MVKLVFLAVSVSLLATILISAATANTAPHTIPLTPVHLSTEVAAQRHEFRLKHNEYYRQLHEKRQNAGLLREMDALQRGQSSSSQALPVGRWNRPLAAESVETSSNSTLVQQILDYLQHLDMMTNVSLGTPSQKILTHVDFLCNDFYFLDSGVVSTASLFGSTEASTVGDRYTPGDSSSSSVTDTFFYAEYGNIDGVVASDMLTMVNYDNTTVTLNATFGDGTVAVVMPTTHNGVIGLAPYNTFSSNLASDALSQMADQLEDPFLSYFLNINEPITAAVTLGHVDTVNCKENSVFYNPSTINGNSSYTFDTTAVSATVTTQSCSDDGQNCWMTSYTYAVDTTKQVELVPFLPAILTSTEVLNVFVAASGAVYNNDTKLYEMADCDAAVKSAVDVRLETADGQKLAITPLDYVTEIAYEDDALLCVLAVFDYYSEENNPLNANTLYLHQGFINNHCVSYKLDVGQIGLADAKQAALWALEL